MRQTRVVPIREIDRSVGPNRDRNGPKPAIVCLDGGFEITCSKRRRVFGQFTADHTSLQRVDGDRLVAISRRQHVVLVNHQRLREPTAIAFGTHMLKETKGMRVGERTVFAPRLCAIAALWIEHATGAAVIRS